MRKLITAVVAVAVLGFLAYGIIAGIRYNPAAHDQQQWNSYIQCVDSGSSTCTAP